MMNQKLGKRNQNRLTRVVDKVHMASLMIKKMANGEVWYNDEDMDGNLRILRDRLEDALAIVELVRDRIDEGVR